MQLHAVTHYTCHFHFTVYVHAMCGSQGITLDLILSFLWVWGLNSGHQACVVSTDTNWAISLALFLLCKTGYFFLCSSDNPELSWTSCLSLLNARIIGMCYHIKQGHNRFLWEDRWNGLAIYLNCKMYLQHVLDLYDWKGALPTCIYNIKMLTFIDF